ncbi:P-loop containing nucleoside triphosphate hydrolase protein [Hypoxylon sp. FL1857]|nr:P-loop containing nucleoside triphosphate hydrolase protein [Hypoxylon sp. FL1857]
MGQIFSKSAARPGTQNVLGNRAEVPVRGVVSRQSISAIMDASQPPSTPQNQVEIYERASLSHELGGGSNIAPSSAGYSKSTVVGTDESPSGDKHNSTRRVPPINIPNAPCFPREDELTESPCSIHGGHAFRRHLRKPSLEIICPDLNEFLRNLAGSPMTCQGDGRLSRFSVNEPYELIFHNRRKLLEVEHDYADGHIRGHVQDLFNFIQKMRPLAWEKIGEIEERTCYEIAFKDLWLLYPPGSTVFNKDDGTWRAYRVNRVEIHPESDSEKILIHCCFLDFDKTGKWLVPQAKVFNVPSYSLERPIRHLDVIPDWCCVELSKSLVERGQTYWSYGRKVFHRRYNGNAWPKTSNEDPVNVIIDYVTSSRHQQDDGLDQSYCTRIVCSICQGKSVQLESYPTDAPHDGEICGTIQAGNSTYNDTLLMFCPSRLWAFSLRHKSWKMISLQELSTIETQAEPFKKLQMEEDNKKALEQLLCGWLENRQASSSLDLIRGKGQGLNILLHGNPGTGKTLTVESLCEKHRIPLYMLTCGDLGNDTDAFEDRLQMAFLRAANWGAILLLEEADVFVRSREDDLQRCAIVSSFLSKLDYSRAVVFMATNRVKVFDVALTSRVHMALTFPDFKFKTQKEIWRDVIRRLQGVNANDKEALEYWVGAELQKLDEGRYVYMNGREIRNCISAASALARKNRNDGSLKDLDVKKILRLGKDFAEYTSQGDRPNIKPLLQDRTRKMSLEKHLAS